VVGRLFLAVPMRDEARHALATLLARATSSMPGKVVPPDNWHLTLRFLGSTEEATYDRLLAGLDEMDPPPAFEIRFGSLGAFPRPSRAAVLWIGLERGLESLQDLAARVRSAAELAGLPLDDRPFRGHLTLSRIRPPEPVEGLLASTPPFGVGMRVDRIVLYRSHLGRPAARYEELESFPLG